MEACIYKTFGRESVLQWVADWPRPQLAPDEVLIAVVASSINPKDGLLRRGKFSRTMARDPLPRVTGLDLSGTVAAIGENVSRFKMGDAVMGMTNNFSGGVLARYAALNESEMAIAPSAISLIESAAIPLAALTALQALRDICDLRPGSQVLIVGASGGVGHFATQIAKQLGAEVRAVCGAENIEFLYSMGADYVYDYQNQAASKMGEHFDAVFDVAGLYRRKHFSQQLGKKGIFVSTVPTAGSLIYELAARVGLHKLSRLVFVQSSRKDLQLLCQWVDQKKIVPYIQKTYNHDEIVEAHSQIQTSHTRGKIVVSLASLKTQPN